MLPHPAGSRVIRSQPLTGALLLALLATCAQAQEIRGLAKFDMRGDAVWGASISLYDSLGRQAGTARSNRKGE